MTGSPAGSRGPSRTVLVVLGALVLVAIVGPWLGDPAAQDPARSLEPPRWGAIAGTDVLGRDLAVRTAAGLRLSLGIGLAASAVAVAVGVIVGTVAGYAGGLWDAALMRLVDVLYGLPYIALVVVLMVVFGRGVLNLLFALAAVSWLTTARIVRAEVRRLRARPFVEAARVLGAGPARIVWRHVLPQLGGTVLIYAALTVPMAIRQEALLSFLGLGVTPPDASLGTLLREGLGALSALGASWWLLVFPALALLVLTAALNAFADGLQRRFDPRRAGPRGGAAG